MTIGNIKNTICHGTLIKNREKKIQEDRAVRIKEQLNTVTDGTDTVQDMQAKNGRVSMQLM